MLDSCILLNDQRKIKLGIGKDMGEGLPKFWVKHFPLFPNGERTTFSFSKWRVECCCFFKLQPRHWWQTPAATLCPIHGKHCTPPCVWKKGRRWQGRLDKTEGSGLLILKTSLFSRVYSWEVSRFKHPFPFAQNHPLPWRFCLLQTFIVRCLLLSMWLSQYFSFLGKKVINKLINKILM